MASTTTETTTSSETSTQKTTAITEPVEEDLPLSLQYTQGNDRLAPLKDIWLGADGHEYRYVWTSGTIKRRIPGHKQWHSEGRHPNPVLVGELLSVTDDAHRRWALANMGHFGLRNQSEINLAMNTLTQRFRRRRHVRMQ